MRIRAAGVLIENDKLLVIHRKKIVDGKVDEYYVIPGGGLESGETLEEATVREMYEEVGICVQVVNKIYQIKDKDGEQNFMLVKHKSGEIQTGIGPEYTEERYKTRGSYSPEYVKISDITSGRVNLVPNEFKNFFLTYVVNGENN